MSQKSLGSDLLYVFEYEEDARNNWLDKFPKDQLFMIKSYSSHIFKIKCNMMFGDGYYSIMLVFFLANRLYSICTIAREMYVMSRGGGICECKKKDTLEIFYNALIFSPGALLRTSVVESTAAATTSSAISLTFSISLPSSACFFDFLFTGSKTGARMMTTMVQM